MLSDESASRALQRIDQWEQTMARRADQARELTRRVAEVSATARSRDGLVEVTLGAEGQIQGLTLDERTRQQPAAATADKIMETLRDARARLIRRLDEVTAETVGADSETGRMLMESLRRRLGTLDGEAR